MTPDIISEAEAANELMRLAKVIARHNRLYHTEDSPEISDADYDALIRRNAELEAQFPHLIREDSPSRQVGAAIESTPLRKVTHELRLYSLDNGFSDEDIAEFLARIRRYLNLADDAPITMTAEDKIDVISLSIRYEGGKLIRAANRGESAVRVRRTSILMCRLNCVFIRSTTCFSLRTSPKSLPAFAVI